MGRKINDSRAGPRDGGQCGDRRRICPSIHKFARVKINWGFGVKETGFSGAPLAPRSVKLIQSIRISWQGRKDAKKYSGLKDFTRTHALITAQAAAQAGQHRVNQWLIQSLDPLLVGNERIAVQEEDFLTQITGLKSQKPESGREARELERKIGELSKLRSNLRSQRKANFASMESLSNSGQEAMKSWETYYDQLASMYSRARAVKSKLDISKVASEVPVYISIPLVSSSNVQASVTKPKARG